jgi:hypothetical protein
VSAHKPYTGPLVGVRKTYAPGVYEDCEQYEKLAEAQGVEFRDGRRRVCLEHRRAFQARDWFVVCPECHARGGPGRVEGSTQPQTRPR